MVPFRKTLFKKERGLLSMQTLYDQIRRLRAETVLVLKKMGTCPLRAELPVRELADQASHSELGRCTQSIYMHDETDPVYAWTS